jgi:hypothetical protein
MSRTDVHAPNWVKERDPAWRNVFKEYHDHRTGPCDIEKFRASKGSFWWRPRLFTRCSTTFTSCGRNIFCGCGMCTNQTGRRTQIKSSRVMWNKAKRLVEKTTREDLLDIDY